MLNDERHHQRGVGHRRTQREPGERGGPAQPAVAGRGQRSPAGSASPAAPPPTGACTLAIPDRAGISTGAVPGGRPGQRAGDRAAAVRPAAITGQVVPAPADRHGQRPPPGLGASAGQRGSQAKLTDTSAVLPQRHHRYRSGHRRCTWSWPSPYPRRRRKLATACFLPLPAPARQHPGRRQTDEHHHHHHQTRAPSAHRRSPSPGRRRALAGRYAGGRPGQWRGCTAGAAPASAAALAPAWRPAPRERRRGRCRTPSRWAGASAGRSTSGPGRSRRQLPLINVAGRAGTGLSLALGYEPVAGHPGRIGEPVRAGRGVEPGRCPGWTPPAGCTYTRPRAGRYAYDTSSAHRTGPVPAAGSDVRQGPRDNPGPPGRGRRGSTCTR